MLSFAALAQSRTKKAFESTEKNLKEIYHALWSGTNARSLIVHLDESLRLYEQFTEGEVKVSVVGDDNHRMVTILDHGTNLKGIVSVKIWTIDDPTDGLTHLIIEVEPISPECEPLIGTLWLSDSQRLGTTGRFGMTSIFSAEQMMLPNLRVSKTAFAGTTRGFTMSLTTTFDFPERSQTVCKELMGSITVATPFGVTTNMLPDTYDLHRKMTKKPDDMLAVVYTVLSLIFAEGVKIFNQKAVRSILKSREMTDDEIVRILVILNKVSVLGEWLNFVDYGDDAFYIPTPKLLCSI